MFSPEQKARIAKVIEDVLLEINHDEMPKECPNFQLHVYGAESWSWADIVPNWFIAERRP